MHALGFHGHIAGVAATLILVFAPGSAQGQSRLLPSSSPIHVDRSSRASEPGLASTSGAFPDAAPVYHNGADLLCSDCHVIHASQTHAYDPDRPGPAEEIPYSGSANPMLLRYADPLDLCLSCHDGQTFAPDVIGLDSNGLVDRSAGFFGQPEEVNASGHDLGRNLPPAGSFELCTRCHFESPWEAKVTCIDCHNPHGNHIARNLQWASDPYGTPELGLFTNPGAAGMSRYERANISYGTLNNSTLREVSNICLDCHHVFSGGHYINPDASGSHIRHPTYDSERDSPNSIAQGAGTGKSDPMHWELGMGSGFNQTQRVRTVMSGGTDYASSRGVDASTNGVFCLSCHRAHGSSHAFALEWDVSGGYSAPGCDQCHYIARVDDTPTPLGIPE